MPFIGFTGRHIDDCVKQANEWEERFEGHIDVICVAPIVLPDGEIQVWIAYEACEPVGSDT
jgi:hypothetical protein